MSQPSCSLLSRTELEFAELPEDLSGTAHESERRRLAEHFIQRRRADIRAYLDIATVFPEREELPDLGYRLTSSYHHLLERVLAYARETVTTGDWSPVPAADSLVVSAGVAEGHFLQSSCGGGDFAHASCDSRGSRGSRGG